jgi:GH24 family phage-related lysozyme (muramidase)
MARLFVVMLKIFRFVLCATLASTTCSPQQTIVNQGTNLCCYNDTSGTPTIGVGFDLTRDDATTVMAAYNLTVSNILNDCERNTTTYCLTDDQAKDLFYRISYPEAAVCVDTYVPNLPTMARAAVIDLAFDSCEILNTFVRMKKDLAMHDWKQAAEELRNSLWCIEVKQRRCTLDYNCILYGNTTLKLKSSIFEKKIFLFQDRIRNNFILL